MKKIFVLILTLITVAVSAQKYTVQQGLYGTSGQRYNADSTLHIPTICGAPYGRAGLKDNDKSMWMKSAIVFDSCGKQFYVYSPKDSSWVTGSVDLSSYAKKGYVDSSVLTRLALVDTAGMLIPYHQAFAHMSFDPDARTLTMYDLIGGGSESVVIPSGGNGGGPTTGIVVLSSSRVGDRVTVSGDNGASTSFSINNTDSATRMHFADTASMLAAYPLKNGTRATGTWGIDISGNAGTVTNGIYSTGSYANPPWITSLNYSKLNGGTASQFVKANGSVDNTVYENTANKGVSNGYAGLDGSGKLPVSQVPLTVLVYRGTWNAATNSPSLSDATGLTGSLYMVTTAGSANLGSGSVTYQVGDYIMHNGSIWQKAAGTSFVNSVSVNGSAAQQGAASITLPNASVTNAQLANSSMTIQGTSVPLGGSITIINGTGFVKATGTTLSYDNSTYFNTRGKGIGGSGTTIIDTSRLYDILANGNDGRVNDITIGDYTNATAAIYWSKRALGGRGVAMSMTPTSFGSYAGVGFSFNDNANSANNKTLGLTESHNYPVLTFNGDANLYEVYTSKLKPFPMYQYADHIGSDVPQTADTLKGNTTTFAYTTGTTNAGTPYSGTVATFAGKLGNYQLQLSSNYIASQLSFRTKNSDLNSWNGWRTVQTVEALAANETDPLYSASAPFTSVQRVGSIPGSVDLNTYTQTGQYYQQANASAASGTNYPAPYAGVLNVYNANNGSSFYWQTYQTYPISGVPDMYFRSYYTGWSGWVKIATSANNNLQSTLDNGNSALQNILLGSTSNTTGYSYTINRSFLGYSYGATMAITGNDANNGGLNLIATGQGTAAKTQYFILAPGASAPVYSPDNQTTKYNVLHTGNITLQAATTNTGANTTNNVIQVTAGLNYAGLTGQGAEIQYNGGIPSFYGYDRTNTKYLPTQFKGGTTNTPNTLQIGADITYNNAQMWYNGGLNQTSSMIAASGATNIPTTGVNAEMAQSGNIAIFQGYNRNATTFIPTQIKGSTTNTANILQISTDLTYNNNQVWYSGGTLQSNSSITLGAAGNTTSFPVLLKRNLSSVDYTAGMGVGTVGPITGANVLTAANATVAQTGMLGIAPNGYAPVYSKDNGTTSSYLVLESGTHDITTTGTITGHIKGTGTPSASVGTQVSGATVSLFANSNDVAGRLVITVPTAVTPTGSGVVARVTFGTAYTTQPFVLIGQHNQFVSGSGSFTFKVCNSSTTYFEVFIDPYGGTLGSLPAGTYNFNYHVIQ